MLRRIVSLVLALLLPATLFAPVHAADAGPAAAVSAKKITTVEGVTEYRLPNGLKLLLFPDDAQQTVTVSITYLVGSRHEGAGESGMAHLLEHMLFKGTPGRADLKGEFQRHGARFNGSTSYDRTNYYETFAASEQTLDWALAMEADRMVNSRVARADLDSEMTVVRNEFESGENSAFGVLRERMAATAYLWHGYGRAIIGNRSDIENVPIDRLQAFYRNYYQPDNAVLLITGRIDEAAALRLAERRFGPVPRPARILLPTYTVEPVQDGERAVTLRRTGDVQIVSSLYHMPPGSHIDYAAVDILVSLLGSVPGGRLHKALIQTGKAANVFANDRQQREAGYAYFGASLRQDMPMDAARDALIGVMEGFAAQPVTADEMERARLRLLNAIDMAVTSSDELGSMLSEAAAMGDWRLLFLHRDRLRAVTLGEVQAAALRYFKPANRTLGMFIPTATPDRAEIPPVPDIAALVRDYKGSEKVAAGEIFEATPANIDARTIVRKLPGGMKLALLPKKTRGATVVAQLTLRWGDEASKAGRSAACGLASAMLMRGTTRHTREQLRDEFDRLKASVGVGGEGASIETVRENLPAVMRLVAEILREPAFPAAEFEQFKRAALTGIEAQRGEPGSLAGLQMSRHLNPYPQEHWLYTPTLEERIARLNAVGVEDLKRCHAEFYGASDADMAVVGDFDAEEVTRLTQELFDGWKSPRAYVRIPGRFTDAPAINRNLDTPDKANAVFRAGLNLRLRDDDPDHAALVLGNYILGGSSSSRLSQRIREQEGLSYSVRSWLVAGSLDKIGEFGVSAIYAPQNRSRIEAQIIDVLQQALRDGFTDEEVAQARKGYLEARKLARTQDYAVAGKLATNLYLSRTMAWDADFDARVAALTAPQIQAALRRHLDPHKLSIVKAGDFARVAEAGAGAASVAEK